MSLGRVEEKRTDLVGQVNLSDAAVGLVTAAADQPAAIGRTYAPGFVFTVAGPVQVNHDLGYLPWKFGPEGQPPVVRGVDIALTADGLITSIYTLLLTT